MMRRSAVFSKTCFCVTLSAKTPVNVYGLTSGRMCRIQLLSTVGGGVRRTIVVLTTSIGFAVPASAAFGGRTRR